MDPATHALTSFALARGFFPRRSWRFVTAVLLAGALADMDLLMGLFGPSAYLVGRFTLTHSLIGCAIAVIVAALFYFVVRQKGGPPQKAGPTSAEGHSSFVLAATLAAVLHLLMDLAISRGVTLLWPFHPTRFAWDFLPEIDPWILALLIAGMFLPELFRLVGTEIGAKQKSPRGRNGALVALALLVFYVGVRVVAHGNALARLDAHSYRGESPRQVGAFPDSFSPITWHGVVETASQVCTVDVSEAGTWRFDPESAVCAHKPEDSAALTTAQKTQTALAFLQATQFPKASVGATSEGFEVVLRDMRDIAQNESLHALAARILLDRKAQVTSQSIVWASSVTLR